MSMIMNKLVNAAVASLLLVSPVLAAASGPANGDDGQPGRTVVSKKLEGHERRPAFSDSQLEKMASLKNQYLDKTASGHSQLEVLYRQLKDTLSQPTIDRARAEGIQAKINSIKGDLSLTRLNLKIDEMGVLTPEQREHMRHRMLVAEAFGGKFAQHRQFGGECGPGKGAGGACGPRKFGGAPGQHKQFGGRHFEQGGPEKPNS
jgi:Spy/CpxP family protein refolding chaperone